MLSLGILGFAAPWLLLALASLPVLWWLLRITPPAPRRIRFPAIRLLLRLQEKEDTPAHTPWWLLLLRLVIATLLIVGLAHPLLNPGGGFQGSGPIVLVVDDGWSSGGNWERRRDVVGELLDRAGRAGRADRQVILLTTAPKADRSPAAASNLMRADDAKAAFQALVPAAWPVDHAAAAEAAAKIDASGANVVWLSDGLRHRGTGDLAAALQRLGRVAVYTDSGPALPLLLHPATLAGNSLAFAASRADGSNAAAYWLRVIAEDGNTVARRQIDFAAGTTRIDVAIELPSELRNRAARIEVERHPSAGATLLLDERLRRRPVGLVAAASLAGSQPLLSDLYYLERALGPFAEIRRGPVSELLSRPLSVVVLADAAPLSSAERARLARWVAEGGTLVRFAGPVLADADDDLVPVRLRRGDRNFGGTMSWTEPQTLAAFDSESPFAGLAVPEDIAVRRQVLAEPTVVLRSRTWASLDDGTPLVTADRREKGLVVLFHTTANPDWSNLPMSGLFVEMLRRLVNMSQGVAAGEEHKRSLSPHQVLDGFGRLGPAPGTVAALDAAALGSVRVGPEHPPGLYGDAASRRSLNLSDSVTEVSLLDGLPPGIARSVYREATEIDLKPWLLTAALILLLLDLLVSFFLRGLFTRRTAMGAARTGALLAGLATGALFGAALLLGSAPATAQTPVPEQPVDEELAIRATQETVFAYVRTGDGETDRVSEAGLVGLGRVLASRTSVEPGAPIAVDPNTDELSFYPVLYWPVTDGQRPPTPQGAANLQRYLTGGGMIIFDIRTGADMDGDTLRRLTEGINIPTLTRVPDEHVLTRTYYLLSEFPGRRAGAPVWVARPDQAAKDGVSPVVIGSNDWASAWAQDDRGRPMFPTVPGGERQREHAFRTGVNLIMYALTGNYKEDQVHLPIIMKRLGQ